MLVMVIVTIIRSISCVVVTVVMFIIMIVVIVLHFFSHGEELVQRKESITVRVEHFNHLIGVHVMLFFKPHVACIFTVLLSGVFIVIFVCVHVVTDAVFVAMFVIVFIAMVIIIAVLVTMVMVMVVCTTHCCDSNGECFHILCLEFKHVFACFEFVD